MFIHECIAPTSSLNDITYTDGDEPLSFSIKKVKENIHRLLSNESSINYVYPIDDIITDNENLPLTELKYIAKTRYNESIDSPIIDLFDSSSINDGKNKIAVINNLNQKKCLYQIDSLCTQYKHVVLVKPRLTSPIDDRVYLLLLSPNNEKKESSSSLPTNAEGIIDFMYCLYCYGQYVVKLAISVSTNSNLTKVKHVKISSEREYKQYIKSIIDKIRELGIELK